MKQLLDPLFHPHSIAVIGVSRSETAVGTTIFRNILTGGYKGALYQINPNAKSIGGRICYPSVTAIAEPIDLAIIVVPAPIVESVLKEIGTKKIPVAVIISAGFREAGEEGKKREEAVKRIAAENHTLIVGPNCLGISHPHEHLNASFARTDAIPGSIAFISQSGAVGAAVLDICKPKGIGFSHFISVGNKAGIDELDILEYLATDDKTNVIAIYGEQLQDAKRFIALSKTLCLSPHPKPIVVLKAGKTKEGETAIHSHTGALAGEKRAYEAMFRQGNIVEAETLQEFLNALIVFSENPLPTHENSIIVTNAGGPAILATDTLAAHGISVKPIEGYHNPIDLLGDANADLYKKTLQDLAKNNSLGSILAIATPQSVTEIEKTAEVFADIKKEIQKPFVVAWMGAEVMDEGKKILDGGQVSITKYPESAATMLSCMHRYAKKRTQMKEQSILTTDIPTASLKTSFQPLDYFSSYGIPVPPYVYTSSLADDAEIQKKCSDMVAVKIISKNIIHKTDQGAIKLNVPKAQAIATAKEMAKNIQERYPDVSINGYLFMDMLTYEHGYEYIVGIKDDPNLGRMVMIGLGGIFVEMIDDVAFGFTPLGREDIDTMLSSLKSFPLFSGVRGKPPIDKKALITCILAVSALAEQEKDIIEMDINPLVVTTKGAFALDGRITKK